MIGSSLSLAFLVMCDQVPRGCPFTESGTHEECLRTQPAGLRADRDKGTEVFLGRGVCECHCFLWNILHGSIDPPQVFGAAHVL